MATGQARRLANMRWYLYARPLHPELFEIHQSRRIVRGAYEAQAWVTGCSHVISFHCGDVSLVEVTASSDTELPKRGLLANLPLRGEREHQCSQAKGIGYMMNFQTETMSPAVYAKTHHDLAGRDGHGGMFVAHPDWATGQFAPFSYIDCQAKHDQLHVLAFHALPEDLTIIKIQSIFELV